MKSLYFNEDHELFRQSVIEYINKKKPFFDQWEEDRQVPKSVWKEMGEMGFLGLMYDEKYGGSNVDFFYSVILMEEMAKAGNAGLLGGFSVHSYMATNHINNIGSEELKQKYLVPSISGDILGAIAFTEPNAGSDVQGITTFAKKEGDHYIINGSKTYITSGCSADYFLTLCKTEAGFDIIVIDGDAPGITRNKLNKIGLHSSDTAEIFFQDVKIPTSNLVGNEGMGFYYVMESFQLERLCCAIMAIGAMDTIIAETLEFMKNRKAFGRPIAYFQVLRHRLADYCTDLECIRSLTYETCWRFMNGEYAIKQASMCKLKATELQNEVVAGCLQMHGGAGYMEDYPIARYFRDARVGTIYGGSSEIMREIIAKVVVDDVQFGKVY
ncbi:acyl-CoA dehydrogenase family protein [Faecalibacter bovis]|uniref:Acyl-CoA dehydrogenase family protein n=1 Tax=Faecalibacter bovis TaxID=2898187 RepID=A0ABX7XAI1_9FLAO|nr:acyl-CoA dehydrogenase family protein [Faecalibacter bovis]QTV04904.1 acyl-CoA dehydrogenase family protein [Faecalibacter bovis]